MFFFWILLPGSIKQARVWNGFFFCMNIVRALKSRLKGKQRTRIEYAVEWVEFLLFFFAKSMFELVSPKCLQHHQEPEWLRLQSHGWNISCFLERRNCWLVFGFDHLIIFSIHLSIETSVLAAAKKALQISWTDKELLQGWQAPFVFKEVENESIKLVYRQMV